MFYIAEKEERKYDTFRAALMAAGGLTWAEENPVLVYSDHSDVEGDDELLAIVTRLGVGRSYVVHMTAAGWEEHGEDAADSGVL